MEQAILIAAIVLAVVLAINCIALWSALGLIYRLAKTIVENEPQTVEVEEDDEAEPWGQDPEKWKRE